MYEAISAVGVKTVLKWGGMVLVFNVPVVLKQGTDVIGHAIDLHK